MTQRGKFEIQWIDRGRPPRALPNPHYPDGCNVNLTGDGVVKLPFPKEAEPVVEHCTAELPYPCGHDNIGTWMVRCLTCGVRAAITAASRHDDPRSVKLACKELPQ